MVRLYRCRICGIVFEQLNQRGRLPVACLDHRRAARRRIDRRKKRENYARGGAAVRPACCVAAGFRQCPQHRQWTTYKYEWKRMVVHPESVEVLSDFTETYGAGGYNITKS